MLAKEWTELTEVGRLLSFHLLPVQLEKYDKLSQIESEKSLECNVAYAQVAIVQHLILGIGKEDRCDRCIHCIWL